MPSARSAMATSLSNEFVRFRKAGKQLRKILKETRNVHESIKREGCFGKEQLDKFNLNAEDEAAVWNIIEQPVGFVVLGSTCWARACIVNGLLGKQLLPVVPFGEEGKHQWRMVRFVHGKSSRAKLVLPNGFEVLEHLEFNEHMSTSVPLADLELKSGEDLTSEEQALNGGILEVSHLHPLLHDNAQLIVSSGGKVSPFVQELGKCLDGIIPVIVYAIGCSLSAEDVAALTELQELPQRYPVFFVSVRHPSMCELTESGQHTGSPGSCPPSPSSDSSSPRGSHFSYSRHHLEQLALIRHYSEVQAAEQQASDAYWRLSELGFLPAPGAKPDYKGSLHVVSELLEDGHFLPGLLLFVSHVLQSRLLLAANLLQDTHARSIQSFITAAFDMSRDLMITPKRIQYARQREEALYKSLLNLANNKQDEIKTMIAQTIIGVMDEVLEKAANYQFQNVVMDAHFQEPVTSKSVRMCTKELRDMVVDHVNKAVADRLVTSIEWLQEKFTGTLERCLLSLEQACSDGDEKTKQASAALKHILTAAYQVEVSFRNSASIFWFFMQKMKQLAEFLPWKLPSSLDVEWKKEVAYRMLCSLNESHLARSVCHQLQSRVRASHERFVASLIQLEEIHIDRLEQRENERKTVRCLYAPKVAKLSLESSSLQDMIQYGMPQIGQELGRGHFGVVYSCKSWAGHNSLAVKTVVLPTEKHWYSLAMEFYYHRNTPEHPRIVQLRGTVIDYKHDRKPTVYLIMERMEKDLYSALWNGLAWIPRLQVALDVIQGIRFLHNQGLVHRDIKLHNVLLDKDNRAKISDLGFCKIEVMMSGSVVGTPIQMAPELLTGHYDSSVDIYAFGVLFWYICSGQPRLPYVYEQCAHKEDLFALLKRGMRPERLSYFDDECWKLMCECWHGNPNKRPLPGDVEHRISAILERFKTQKVMVVTQSNDLSRSLTSDCWSTYYESSAASKSYLVVTDSVSR